MDTSKTERERLEDALLADAPDLVDAVIAALTAAGAQPEWDSETIEAVLEPLQDFVKHRGFPPVGAEGPDGEYTQFWQTVQDQGQ